MPESYEMKYSGSEWLGLVPISWKIGNIGSLYSLRNTKVSDRDYPPLSVTMKGIVPQLETAAKTDDHDSRKLVKKGDFAINSRSDRRGSCGISEYDGSVSLINTVLTPRGNMIPRYYNWLFHTVQFADEFYKNGHGIVDDLWTTRWDEMKRILIPVPSESEQIAIAFYLDTKITHIDEIIAEATSSIEAFKALKQAVIFEAVTQGIDGSHQTKESGVFWAQRIPDTWDVGKVARYFSVELGKMLDEKRISGARLKPYLRNADVQWSGINTNDLNEMDFSEEEDDRYGVKSGDLLVCEGGDVGKSCIVPDGFPEGVYYQKALHRVRAYDNDIYSLKWLRYVLFVMSKYGFFNGFSGEKATIQHLPAVTFNQLKFPMPKQKEKERIVLYLEDRIPEYDALITEKQALIQDLQAYKKSLVYEVVTGKRKVV